MGVRENAILPENVILSEWGLAKFLNPLGRKGLRARPFRRRLTIGKRFTTRLIHDIRIGYKQGKAPFVEYYPEG